MAEHVGKKKCRDIYFAFFLISLHLTLLLAVLCWLVLYYLRKAREIEKSLYQCEAHVGFFFSSLTVPSQLLFCSLERKTKLKLLVSIFGSSGQLRRAIWVKLRRKKIVTSHLIMLTSLGHLGGFLGKTLSEFMFRHSFFLRGLVVGFRNCTLGMWRLCAWNCLSQQVPIQDARSTMSTSMPFPIDFSLPRMEVG